MKFFISAAHYENGKISKLRKHSDSNGTPSFVFEDVEKMIVVVAIMMGIDYFTAPKDKYGNWKDGQKIHYYKNNDDKYFLRTDSNQTSSDNLGELPTF